MPFQVEGRKFWGGKIEWVGPTQRGTVTEVRAMITMNSQKDKGIAGRAIFLR